MAGVNKFSAASSISRLWMGSFRRKYKAELINIANTIMSENGMIMN